MTDWPGKRQQAQWPGSPSAGQEQSPERGAFDKLLGIGGERYQLWPERLARSALGAVEGGGEMVKKAETGQYGPPGSREFSAKAIPDAVQSGMLGVGAAPEAVSGLAGSADLASRALQLRRTLPSKAQIKSSATAAYDAVKDARLVAKPEAIDDLVAGAMKSLDDDLITSINAPRTFRAMEQLQAAGGDIAQIMSIRQKLGKILPSEGTEYAAASHTIPIIDKFIETLSPENVISGDPSFTASMLNHARSSWGAFKKLDHIDRAIDLAEHRAKSTGTGSNFQNVLRQEIRKILDSDKTSRGFSEKTKQKMEQIIEGTFASNTARNLGKFAPSGPVSMWSSIMAGLAGGPEAGAAVGIGAWLAKKLGTHLTRKQIRELTDLIRMESPLGKAAVKGAREAPENPDAAALRSAGPAVPLTASALGQSLPQMVEPYDPYRS